jgi:DNA-directed RNA polymerase subunit RPC12/RpoP
MTCLECGAESAQAAHVCARCGAPMTDEPSVAADPAAEPVQIICPECGADTGGLALGALGWAWPGAAGPAEATHVCARCRPPVAYQPFVAGNHAVGQRVSPGMRALRTVGIAIGILAVLAGLAACALFVRGASWPPSGP